jgi:MFS family permease
MVYLGSGDFRRPLISKSLLRHPGDAELRGEPHELQLPAGALPDRFDRRLTMIICDSARAVLLAVPGILIVLHLASWPVVLIEGGAGTIFDPAATAALPGIVPDGQLEQAWAATEARTHSASLAGPALGGVLSGLGRAAPCSVLIPRSAAQASVPIAGDD